MSATIERPIDQRLQLLFSDVEAGAILGMGRSKLIELTLRGEIHSIKIDGMRRYHIDDLHAFAERLRSAS